MCAGIYDYSNGQFYSIYTLNFCKKCKAGQEKINVWPVPKTSNFKLFRERICTLYNWAKLCFFIAEI